MPTFSNSLPKVDKHVGFDLRRTPATGSIKAVVTCEEFLVCDTHYWHGRTLPCERIVNEEGKTVDDSACPACVAKQSWRTHVYVSCFDPKTVERFLFECTAAAAKPFEEYKLSAGSLRGCLFCASRPKGDRNSKVWIETNTFNQARQPLPPAPDVAAALAVIWRIPATAVSSPAEHSPLAMRTGNHATLAPTARISKSRMREMREQIDNAGDPPTIGEVLSHSGNGSTRRI